MSQQAQQPPKPVDQERLNAYVTQFKTPFQSVLSTLNQMGPNAIDQLIQQCVTLEEQVKILWEQNEELNKEKIMRKTMLKDENLIIKDNELTNQRTMGKPSPK